MTFLTFMGEVYQRSSRPGGLDAGEPVSESRISECNPQRELRIKKETGWERVEPGTLNMKVADGVFYDLAAMPCRFLERPEDVQHPDNPSIPRKRRGYFYYRAIASATWKKQEVLIKRAGNPWNRWDEPYVSLELYAPVRLMEHLSLKAGIYSNPGSEVEVTVEVLAKGIW